MDAHGTRPFCHAAMRPCSIPHFLTQLITVCMSNLAFSFAWACFSSRMAQHTQGGGFRNPVPVSKAQPTECRSNDVFALQRQGSLMCDSRAPKDHLNVALKGLAALRPAGSGFYDLSRCSILGRGVGRRGVGDGIWSQCFSHLTG